VSEICLTITPEDGHMRMKHVVLTNNNKVKDLVTLMDNKEQILGVNKCNRMLKYNMVNIKIKKVAEIMGSNKSSEIRRA
jgi:hypothetical protein